MLQSVFPASIVRKSFLGAALIGACGLSVACSQKVKTPVSDNTEIISKEAADALKSNALNIDFLQGKNGNDMFAYDSEGRITQESVFDENNSLYRFYTYEYNPDGTAKRDVKHYADGSIESETLYYYNSDGTKYDVTTYDDGVKWVREYDSEDNVIHAIVYKPNSNSIDLEYSYSADESGNRIETIYDGKGNIISD